MAKDFKELAKILKKKRVESGFTQNDIAEKLNIHSQFVSNWERGICAPPGHSMNALIALLKVNKRSIVEALVSDSRRAIEARIYKAK